MKKSGIILFSFVFLLIVWYGAAIKINSILILPHPHQVILRLIELIPSQKFRIALGTTFFRCAVSFLISFLISVFVGLLMGFVPFFKTFFSFYLSIIKSTPVVSFILLAVFWFKSSNVPIFVSILMTISVLTNSVCSGVLQTDKKLLQMAQVYNFSFWQKLRWIYVPSIFPFFVSGALSSLGLTWKVIIAGEIICLPKNSVGSLLQSAKVHLETVDVFAYTLAVVLLSFSCESIFGFYVQKRGKK